MDDLDKNQIYNFMRDISERVDLIAHENEMLKFLIKDLTEKNKILSDRLSAQHTFIELIINNAFSIDSKATIN